MTAYIAKDECVQVPEAVAVHIPATSSQNFHSYVADTLTRFSGALGAVTRGAATLEARLASNEQKLALMQQKHVEVANMQGKLANGLGTHERALGELQIRMGCLLKLESSSEATERRLSTCEQQHRLSQSDASESAKKHAGAIAEVRDRFKNQLDEHAAAAARDLHKVERELDACRHQISELHRAGGSVAPMRSSESLNSWLDDILADTCERVEEQIARASEQLHCRVETESRSMKDRLEHLSCEMMQTWKAEAQQVSMGVQVEMRAEKEKYSKELLMLCAGIEDAMESWITRIRSRRCDSEPWQRSSQDIAKPHRPSSFGDACEQWIERVRNGPDDAGGIAKAIIFMPESENSAPTRNRTPSPRRRCARGIGRQTVVSERRHCHIHCGGFRP